MDKLFPKNTRVLYTPLQARRGIKLESKMGTIHSFCTASNSYRVRLDKENVLRRLRASTLTVIK